MIDEPILLKKNHCSTDLVRLSRLQMGRDGGGRKMERGETEREKKGGREK